MSDPTDTEFTQEDLLSHARGNATACVLTAFAHLKEQGQDPDEYVAFFGRWVAPGWEQMRGRSVADVAREAALNAVSVGGELRSFAGDDTSAEALIAGWPGDELLDALQLTQGDGDRLWSAFAPIMEHLGIHYRWQREGEAVRMTFEVERA